jgi:hypothetical protein
MIKILTIKGDGATNFLQDVRLDFWQDVEKGKDENTIFVSKNDTFSLLFKYIYHFLEYLPFSFRLPSFRFFRKKDTCFAIILGPDFSQFLTHKLAGDEIVVYMMDAWPSYHPRIEKAIKILGIKTIFFSSRQVADIFREKGVLEHSIWLPEAVRIDKFYTQSQDKKDIDVLNFGRKWDEHHDKIVKVLEEAQISYIYEKIKGVIVLPTREDFLNALSRAKITICVPSNITHPERSGAISTITMRYFQCMASKTIVLGVAPEELKDLFGYNPILEINVAQPVEQIKNILDNLGQYSSLIEKNYQMVKEKHTWVNRWLIIQSYINTIN